MNTLCTPRQEESTLGKDGPYHFYVGKLLEYERPEQRLLQGYSGCGGYRGVISFDDIICNEHICKISTGDNKDVKNKGAHL